MTNANRGRFEYRKEVHVTFSSRIRADKSLIVKRLRHTLLRFLTAPATPAMFLP